MPILRPNETDQSTIWEKTDPDKDFYEEVRDDNDTSYILIDFGPVLPTIMDNYSESNYLDWYYSIGDMFASEVGQSFTGDGGILNSAKFYIRTPYPVSGNVYAKIYEETHATAFGIDSKPTGDILAISDVVNVEDINDISFELYTFIFSGVNKITLTNGIKYCVALEYGGIGEISVALDNTSPTHSGNGCYFQGGNWTVKPEDFIFYVYKD